MPEGPEIRRAADQIAQAIVDQPLTSVWFARENLQTRAAELAASRVTAVRTKGKAMLTDFACGLTVYSHNQLYGRWYVRPTGKPPKTRRTLRWALETPTRAALLYSASEIDILRTEEVCGHPFVARAGIDLLSEAEDIDDVKAHINQDRFKRRALGALLLDQSFIAGIGNYLRSEILFTARLHPETRLRDLNGHGVRRVAREALRLTVQSYETGGITNDLGRVKRLKKEGWTRGRFRHHVFARAGQPCHQCRTKINKCQFSGRRLYWCPSCQDWDGPS